MTRWSKREVERALENLASDDGSAEEMLIVHEDPETGQWYDGIGEDAEPVDEAEAEGADQVIVLREEIVETGWSKE